ncbi:hypothetical protein M3Y94_00687500 [Aphelenchoides besseyi]|nr:hypothetical protein M3Y94_00687500 [Aphelenchoides besseyi]
MMHSILLLLLVGSSMSSPILIANNFIPPILIESTPSDVPVNLPTDPPTTQQSTQTSDSTVELIDPPIVFDPLEANATTETPPPETFPPIVIAGEISKREVDVEGSGNSSLLPENLSFSDFRRLEEKEEGSTGGEEGKAELRTLVQNKRNQWF